MPPPEPALVVFDIAPPKAPHRPETPLPPGPSQAAPIMPETPVPTAIVKLRPERPSHAPAAENRIEDAGPAADRTTAPPQRPLPPAPPTGQAAVSWEGMVLARLNQFRRYPVTARRRGEEGTPYIRFVIDRQGMLVSSRLERSCGHSALDREAVALPSRAQPLPPPPADRAGEVIELIVPVEYFIR